MVLEKFYQSETFRIKELRWFLQKVVVSRFSHYIFQILRDFKSEVDEIVNVAAEFLLG